ncbi:tRNA (adenosine(37)-N6)-threonylcarbamoyltransferase complex ATPase subunit type 1 TsaE [Spiroplasma endosymbiont of Polydrusus pterygomalis]|uniref:tRNA (adenosine(37)-N6)-threonylcarbamoyltransferase complex ATPase subunit type 1 TsaE n=1 Tax=Spiroplasma endosymbiont of Polydrusus pterygomalis TaxID=3139327 RepID=UPI003CCA8E09
MKKNKYLLKNLDDTNSLAQIIAKIVKPNLVLLLNGPLGSGKTQITKLIGRLLGVKDVINSPTFIIYKQYQTKYKWNLIHIDAYRLIKPNIEEYYEIMINNFTIIEWSEKLSINFNNYQYIAINFKIIDINSREITINTNLLPQATEKYLINSLASL